MMAINQKSTQERRTDRSLCHAINNRMNALTIGMSVLENHSSDDVRDIAQMLQGDLSELYELLSQLRNMDDR